MKIELLGRLAPGSRSVLTVASLHLLRPRERGSRPPTLGGSVWTARARSSCDAVEVVPLGYTEGKTGELSEQRGLLGLLRWVVALEGGVFSVSREFQGILLISS